MVKKVQQPKSVISQSCGPEEVRLWIKDLSSSDKRTRTKARESIKNAGDLGVQCLVQAMGQTDPNARWESMKIIDDLAVDWNRHADEATIRALVVDLGSDEGLIRTRARRALVKIGSKAVPGVIKALRSDDQRKRWESAKALSEIGDDKATTALIDALDDDNFDVRWLAAEGIIHIGRNSVVELLNRLVERADSLAFREGVHHILQGAYLEGMETVLIPVRKAIEDSEPAVEIPVAVDKALRQVETILATEKGRTRRKQKLGVMGPYEKTPRALETNNGLFAD